MLVKPGATAAEANVNTSTLPQVADKPGDFLQSCTCKFTCCYTAVYEIQETPPVLQLLDVLESEQFPG